MDGKKLTTVQVKKLLNGNKETFSLKCGLFQTYLFVCLPIGGSVKSICFENPTACFWCYNWMDELGFGGLEDKM